MPSPATSLSALVACASVAGAFCWPLYVKNRQLYENSAPAPAATLGESPKTPVAAENTLVGQFGNTTQDRQLEQLQKDLEQARAENADLRKQLSAEKIAKMPPPTVEDILAKVELLMGQKFTSKPNVVAKPLNEIGLMVANMVKSQLPPEAALLRMRAYQALGLVPEANYNLTELLGDLAAEQWQSYYDAESNTIFYQEDANLRRTDGRYRLVSGAVAALIGQSCPSYKNLRYASDNEDEARALRGFVLGEINTARSVWDTQDDFMNILDDTQPPMPYAPTTGPHYLMEDHKRSIDAGKMFIEFLSQSITNAERLARARKSPPRSSAELLHPELYFNATPFQPQEINVADPAVNGQAPLFTNVLGELGIQTMLSSFGTPELAALTAAGWQGDRYYIYAGSDPVNADLYWKTTWVTHGDAKEFSDAMVRILPRRFSIPLKSAYFEKDRFAVRDPNRVIVVQLNAAEKSVTLLTATSQAAGAAMEAKFFPPAVN